MDIFQQDETGTGAVAGITLKEYRKNHASQEQKKSLRTWSIVGYVLCGINAVVALMANPFGLIDLAIQLGLVLGVHLGKSKGCAIGLMVYAVINCVITLVSTGTFGGWMWLVVAGGFLAVFKKIDAEYKAEMNPTTVPADMYQSSND